MTQATESHRKTQKNKGNSVKICGILWLILLFIICPLFAQPQSAFDKAIKEYMKGNVSDAIMYLETTLFNEPENQQAKELLLKANLRLGQGYFEQMDYEKALPFLERAHELAPEDKKITSLYEMVKKQTLPPKPLKKKKIATYKKEFSYWEKISERFEKEIAELKIQREEEEKLKEDLRAKIEKEEKLKVRRWLILGIIIFIINASLISIILYLFFFLKHEKFREKILIQEQKEKEKEYTEALKQQEKKFAETKKQNLSQKDNEISKELEDLSEIMKKQSQDPGTKICRVIDGEEVVFDIDLKGRARAKSVELMEDMFTNPELSQKLLSPFLKDANNRVRAQAALSLYRYTQEKALDVLEEMSESEDKWMRLSAAWAFGEIGTSQVAKYLQMLLNDPDDIVKKRAQTSWEKIIRKEE